MYGSAPRSDYAPLEIPLVPPDLTHGPPPPYSSFRNQEKFTQHGSKWHPRTWSRAVKLGVIAVVIVIVAAIIIGAVVGTKANEYPDYSPLPYKLQDTYSGPNFFDNFDYFTGYDPTAGYVHYVDEIVATSQQYNLTYATEDSAVLKVDTTDQNADTGRYSVRITSKKQYESGLFIFDIVNTPYGCSTWPALWLSDPSNWPENGEIDVVEAVNQGNTGNQAALHTTGGCKMDVKRKETGHAEHDNCKNTTNDNAGCGVKGSPNTYGQAFNAAGGGIYAMEWRSAGIRVWLFPRSSIPADIPTDVANTTAPDPSTWPTPLADFPSTSCNIGEHFRNQSIIANIDLCGTWAGSEAVYKEEDQCPGTCTNFVATNATAFETAVWEWKSWRVYTAS